MNNPEHVQIPTSLFGVGRWLQSILRRCDPAGNHIQHLGWFSEAVDVTFPYLFPMDPYGASAFYAGEPPRYVADDPDSDEHGVAIWHLTAPCVVVIAGHDRKRRLVLQVIAVARARDYLEVHRRRRNQPQADLVSAFSALIHLPKREQQALGAPPPPKPPNHAAPEGRDLDGEA